VTTYVCDSELRRDATRAIGTVNGIDYLEVVTADQRRLAVHFLRPLPGQAGGVPTAPVVTADNVRIDGGERVVGVRVTVVAAANDVLTVDVDRAGDFSTYTLRLVASPTDDEPPPGFDPALSSVAFSFKVACPSDFDCLVDATCVRPVPDEPDLTYLAKDYASFVQLLEGRLSLALPDWRERNPADVMVTLLEVLAHAGDILSYQQDAVATEAYLGTARSRISVRRHARLLDYRLHDGCNARVWLAIDAAAGSASDGATVPAGTRVLGRGASSEPTMASTAARALPASTLVFESMHALTLQAARSRIAFHTWSDEDCCLPAGATAATFVNTPDLGLAAGDVLLLQESVSPVTGLPQDADRAARQAVRLVGVQPGRDPVAGVDVVDVRWADSDALGFPLRLSARVVADAPTIATAVARGNVVLADAGRTVADGELVPASAPASGRYRPVLRDPGVTMVIPYDDAVARTLPARDALRQDPRACRPAVTLDDGSDVWTPLPDLLGAPRFAPVFVVEVERDAVAHVRFGDDVAGRAPAAGAPFTAHYRIGNGAAGNVGSDVLTTLVLDAAGITSVSNLLPAQGGTDPESMARARAYAPSAFRRQERAVTEADYVEIAERHPEVQHAAARIRWTGSWYTAYVTVDRRGGRTFAEDPVFAAAMRDYLDAYRLAGYDVELADPAFGPLDLALDVCVRPGYFRAHVKQALLTAFSSGTTADGRPGFFNPDRWSFGQPLYASAVYDTALSVAGVESVQLTVFQRFGKVPAGELAAGVVSASPLEVLRLDNDPSQPEHGRLAVDTAGGL
jgi:hypothetical protein